MSFEGMFCGIERIWSITLPESKIEDQHRNDPIIAANLGEREPNDGPNE
jgi:hypothetical protein